MVSRKVRQGQGRSERRVPTHNDPARAARQARREGRLAAAATHFEIALQVNPELHTVRHELALIWVRLGHWTTALQHLKRLTETDQTSAAVWSDLGIALHQMGQVEEAGVAFTRSVALDDSSATARAHLGHWYQDRGDLEAAQSHYRDALGIDPTHSAALLGQGELFLRSGKSEAALENFRRALAVGTRDHQAFLHVVESLVGLGRMDEALAHTRGLLSAWPSDCGGLGILALLERECGQREAESLLDLDGLVFQDWLDPPLETHSLEAFCQSLAEHVTQHRSLIQSPHGHATVSGGHTGELLVEPKGPLALLEGQLEARFLDVWRKLPQESLHPWIRHRPARVTLNVWGVVLGEGGYQTPHLHPEAWLSGVVYVALPEPTVLGNGEGALDDKERAHRGWLELGTPDPRLGLKAAARTRFVRPELGKIVLFPSFFYHRTVPFQGPGQRVSIAFDVIGVETIA